MSEALDLVGEAAKALGVTREEASETLAKFGGPVKIPTQEEAMRRAKADGAPIPSLEETLRSAGFRVDDPRALSGKLDAVLEGVQSLNERLDRLESRGGGLRLGIRAWLARLLLPSAPVRPLAAPPVRRAPEESFFNHDAFDATERT